ncbi:MAG: PA2169 family four-helix-bundle protein [Gammaproteobacteria bacterium]
MTHDEIISTLNDLIETSKDGEYGFKTCAEDVKDMELKQVFTAAAQRCAEGANELQEQVRLLGGDPDKHSSVAGTLHRAWVDVKAAITGKDEQAVLEECERGEDVAKKTYEKALAGGLPANIRSIVQRQYQGVVENHDRVRDLRNRYRKAN